MSIRIGVGAGLGAPLSPQDYWSWVDFCEDSGIDSVWHSEQLLGVAPDPLIMLAALAARTKRLRFGTNALVVPFHDPITIAKQLATIAFLSNGRVFPVIGVGLASDPYWAATQTRASERGRRADEAIVLIRQLLHQRDVNFEGTHFRYSGPGIQPQPQKNIPLWTGGHSEAAIRRTAELGDGWLGGPISPETAGQTRRSIEAALGKFGRTIEDDHFGVTLLLRIGATTDPSVVDARKRVERRLPEAERTEMSKAFAIGTSESVVATLRRYIDAGMSKFVVLPISESAHDLLAQMQLLVREVIPAIETQ